MAVRDSSNPLYWNTLHLSDKSQIWAFYYGITVCSCRIRDYWKESSPIVPAGEASCFKGLFFRLKTLILVVKIVFAQQHYLRSRRHCQVLASVCMSCPFWLFKEKYFKTAWEDEVPLVLSIHLSVPLLFTLSSGWTRGLTPTEKRGKKRIKFASSLAYSLLLKSLGFFSCMNIS